MTSKKPVAAATICDDGIELDRAGAAVRCAAPPISSEDWSAQQAARELNRRLRRSTLFGTAATSSTSKGSRRFAPQNLFDQLEHATTPAILTAGYQAATATQSGLRRSRTGQALIWLLVLMGAVAMIAGISIIAWSISAEQMLYWNLGLGLALGGQGALILGLVLVVSRLWRNSRFAAGKLQDVHSRLVQLQHTAEALTAMRSGGAPAFYADLVRGASPQMLLTNLKGQVDQLATRLGSSW
jgi:hypothetical protein